MPTTEQIHAMLDRYRAAASPFSGSSLLAARYHDVPLLSSAWAIGHVGLPFSESGHIALFGLQLPLPEDTTFVASLRYGLGAVHLRVEDIAPTEADAASSAASLNMLLQLIRTIQPKVEAQSDTPDVDAVRKFSDSIRIEQKNDRAILTASVPLLLLRQLANPETAALPAAAPDAASAHNSTPGP
jgi:hypothetical protein